MTNLEEQEMILELKRVEVARLDMQIKIIKLKNEISRLEGFVDVQLEKEKELQSKLK